MSRFTKRRKRERQARQEMLENWQGRIDARREWLMSEIKASEDAGKINAEQAAEFRAKIAPTDTDIGEIENGSQAEEADRHPQSRAKNSPSL